MRKSLRWIVLAFCFIPLIVGCSKLKNKVVKHVTNQPPIVYLVNIPPDDSKYSISPRIYWYGIDPDGYVDRYQYIVIPEIMSYDSNGSTVEIDLGLIPKLDDGSIDSLLVKCIESIPADKWNPDSIKAFLEREHYNTIDTYSISPESVIVEDSVGSEENVRLFAELDTIKWVSQYIFIRAVDNEGLTSKIWKPDQKGGNVFRRFSRNNHPPKVHIPSLEGELPFLSGLFVSEVDTLGVYLETYCLPEITETWKGFEINWYGSDSSDYPRKQPDFLFKWELLGPFQDSSEVIDARTKNESVIDSSYDFFTNSRWIWDKSKVFVNLKNYNEEVGGTYGWYLFRVKSKDDALVESQDTAYAFIKVIHPSFSYSDEEKILIVEASKNDPNVQPIVDPIKFDEVREIYKAHLEEIRAEVGFTSFDIWIDSSEAASPSGMRLPPDIHLMSLYDLIIVINYGGKSGIDAKGVPFPGSPEKTPPDYGYMAYNYYLNVGGKVWFIGIDNFAVSSQMPMKGVHLMDPEDGSSNFYHRPDVVIFARDYFGIEGVFFPNWELDSVATNEEFVRAEPFLGALEFPVLEVDSARLDDLIWWDDAHIQSGLLTPRCWSAIPGVNYEVISTQAQRIYTFVSFLGPNSEMHERPCGSRFIGPTFKTAEFCFPLFLMKDKDAKKAMRLMLEWFFEE